MPLGLTRTITTLLGGSGTSQPTPTPATTTTPSATSGSASGTGTGTPVDAPATVSNFTQPATAAVTPTPAPTPQAAEPEAAAPEAPAPEATTPEAATPEAATPEASDTSASAATVLAAASEPTPTPLDVVADAVAAAEDTLAAKPKSGWYNGFATPASSESSATGSGTLAAPVADDEDAARARAIRALDEQRGSDLIENLSAARNKAAATAYDSGLDAFRAADTDAGSKLNRAA